jgi:hypothetical protein
VNTVFQREKDCIFSDRQDQDDHEKFQNSETPCLFVRKRLMSGNAFDHMGTIMACVWDALELEGFEM